MGDETPWEAEGSGGMRASGAQAHFAQSSRPTLRSFLTGVAILVTATVAVAMLVLGIDVLLAAFGGVLIGVALQAPADWVRRHTPLSYTWALISVLGLSALLLGVGGWLLAPQVAEQADELRRKIPELAEQLEETLRQYEWTSWILEQAREGGVPDGMLAGGANALSALGDLATYLLVALFVGLFAAASPDLYKSSIAHLAPLRHRARVHEILSELGHTLRWWLLGQVVTMVIIGISTALVMWAFGLPLAIVVGLLVGLLGFIPYLGPILGAVPVLLIAVTENASTLLYVLLVYIGVQTLEGYVAGPLVHKRTVYLPPVFTIVVQVLLAFTVGLMGVVLATPLAAVLLVLTRFYRRDLLGDPEAARQLEAGGRSQIATKDAEKKSEKG